MPHVRAEQWLDWRAEVTPRTVMGFPGPDIPSYTRHHSGETHLQLFWERTLSFLSFSGGGGGGETRSQNCNGGRGDLL